MADSQHPQDDSDRLRAEILILSASLTNLQCRPSESHPEHHDWPLCSDISTLLTIGNDASPEARIVNTVVGKINEEGGVDRLICVENAFQDYDRVCVLKSVLKNGTRDQTDDSVDRGPDNSLATAGTEPSAQMATGSERGCQEFGYLARITPNAENGQTMLTPWREEGLVNGMNTVKKYVIDSSISIVSDTLMCSVILRFPNICNICSML